MLRKSAVWIVVLIAVLQIMSGMPSAARHPATQHHKAATTAAQAKTPVKQIDSMPDFEDKAAGPVNWLRTGLSLLFAGVILILFLPPSVWRGGTDARGRPLPKSGGGGGGGGLIIGFLLVGGLFVFRGFDWVLDQIPGCNRFTPTDTPETKLLVSDLVRFKTVPFKFSILFPEHLSYLRKGSDPKTLAFGFQRPQGSYDVECSVLRGTESTTREVEKLNRESQGKVVQTERGSGHYYYYFDSQKAIDTEAHTFAACIGGKITSQDQVVEGEIFGSEVDGAISDGSIFKTRTFLVDDKLIQIKIVGVPEWVNSDIATGIFYSFKSP